MIIAEAEYFYLLLGYLGASKFHLLNVMNMNKYKYTWRGNSFVLACLFSKY